MTDYSNIFYGTYTDDNGNEVDYVYNRRRSGHEVMQVDIESGEILETYNSASDAARAVGVTRKNISDVCNRKRRTAAGYFWLWKDDYDISYYTEPIQTMQNYVCTVLNLDSGEVKAYPSIRQVINSYGISYRTLMHRSSYGLPWHGHMFRIKGLT